MPDGSVSRAAAAAPNISGGQNLRMSFLAVSELAILPATFFCARKTIPPRGELSALGLPIVPGAVGVCGSSLGLSGSPSCDELQAGGGDCGEAAFSESGGTAADGAAARSWPLLVDRTRLRMLSRRPIGGV